jgi:outer membrane protein TolC
MLKSRLFIGRFFTWLVLALVEMHNAFSFDVLNENIVVDSAMMHYPKVYISQQKVQIAEAKFKEARGGFDTTLNVKNRQFASGYYEDTGYLQSTISKPLPLLNAKVYGGYTRSYNGDYPEINQYYNTRSEGRAIFGFEVSLLRGFLTNERNAIRDISKLDINIAKHSNNLMQAQVKADARKAYWRYFYLTKIVKLYEHGLDVAMKRQNALEIQVKNGDKAEIVLAENRRVVLRRQTLIENVKREMLNNVVNLTMFLRLSDGELYTTELVLSKKIKEQEFFSKEKPPIIKHNFDDNLTHRLDIKISEILIKQNNIKLKLAKNDILPTVDLAVETSKDYGTGVIQKEHRLNKVSVNVTVPLENRKQIGKYSSVKAEQSVIKNEIRLLKDYVTNEIKMVVNRIKETEQVFENTQEEIMLAKKLLDAENIRFENGDSDFFMVNAREQDLLNVEEFNIRNKLLLTEMLIEYQFITKDSVDW